MRWFDRHPLALGAYALAALLALFELAMLWQALNPDVPDTYRAYYIDHSTTCLPQPVTGAYRLGTLVDFRSGGDETRELRPCGWDGPAGDGVHSIGERSQLQFHVGEPLDLTLALELTAVTLPGPDRQHVLVSADGQPLGELVVTPGQTGQFALDIPATAVDQSGRLTITLDYPDAISPGPRTANTHWRAIKLSAARLAPR